MQKKFWYWRSNEDIVTREKNEGYPSIAQIVGNVLNSSFIDSLESDIERLTRINRTISHIPPDILHNSISLRPV